VNRQLLLLVAVSLVILSCSIKYYDYLCIGIAYFRSQPSIAERKRKNKSCQCHLPISVIAPVSTHARSESQHSGW
jgi:hypothetical protein